MSDPKPAVPFIVKICLFIIGLQLVSTFVTTLSVANQWVYFYGIDNYNLLNFMSSVPNMLIFPFIPRIVGFFKLQPIFFVNICVQLLVCVLFIISPYISGQAFSLISDSTRFKLGYAVALSSFLISSFFFAITKTAIFIFGARFSRQVVQIHITGYSSANLIISLYFFLLNSTVSNLFTKQIYSYLAAILFQVIGVIAFLKAKSLSPVSTKSLEKKVSGVQKESQFRLIKRIFRKKWLIILLNFLLYYETLLVYPTMMFRMIPSNPSISKYWGNILMFIFGVSEVSSRTLNALNLSFIQKMITEKTLLILCVIRSIVCIVPLFTFIAARGYYTINAILADIVNVVFYALLAFSLGLLGNSIVIFMYSSMEDETDIGVAGTLYSVSVVFGIFCGSLTSFLIVNQI